MPFNLVTDTAFGKAFIHDKTSDAFAPTKVVDSGFQRTTA